MKEIKDNNSNPEFSINGIYFLIKSNIYTIIILVLTVIALSFVYALLQVPKYSSTASIMIDNSQSSVSTIFDFESMGQNRNYLENEIEVLKSRSIAENTIRSLIKSEYKDNLLLFKSKKYEYNDIQKALRKLLFLDWNVGSLNVINESISDSLFHKLVEALQKKLEIKSIRGTDILNISYESPIAEESAIIVNTVVDVYRNKDQEWASTEMSHLKNFLNDQLKIKKQELNTIEQNLKKFQEKEQIYGLDNNSQLLLNELTDIESEYHKSLAAKNILEEKRKYFNNQLTNDEKEFSKNILVTINEQLSSKRTELSTLESEYSIAKNNFGDSHPGVILLETKINNLKESINNQTKDYINQGVSHSNPLVYRQSLMDTLLSIDSRLYGFVSGLDEMNKMIKKYELELSTLPGKYLIFSQLSRDKIIIEETYNLMKQKFEESRITEASQLGKVRVIDYGDAIEIPTSMRKRIYLIMGFVFGIFISFGYILIKEFLDSTIKSIEEIESRDLAILSLVPSIASGMSVKHRKKGYKQDTNKNLQRRLLTREDPKSPISESYRSLRTSLMLDYSSSNLIMVSSSGPGEGKSTTIANLAITFAYMGKKTLLLDADLRKPVIHKVFDIDSQGLTNYLSGGATRDKIIYNSEIENLDIIPSGIIPPNPSELLSNPKMEILIEELKKDYDVILFDTPPLIAVTDALVLSKFMDRFILVIRAGVAKRGALDRVLKSLDNIDEKIYGAVFNGISESNTYGSGYYYNYYQYYYGKEK